MNLILQAIKRMFLWLSCDVEELERKVASFTVNGVSPDENGNVEIEVPESTGGVNIVHFIDTTLYVGNEQCPLQFTLDSEDVHYLYSTEWYAKVKNALAEFPFPYQYNTYFHCYEYMNGMLDVGDWSITLNFHGGFSFSIRNEDK